MILSAVPMTDMAGAWVEPSQGIGQFTRIGVEQGLSNSTVLSICQDGDGCIWFATPNGLNRFDGHEISVFNSTNSPLPDNIGKLARDGNGNVLACTDKGLFLYDIGRDEFRPADMGSGKEVVNAAWMEDGGILFSTASEIVLLKDNVPDTLYVGRRARSICADGGRIVVGSGRGEISCYSDGMSSTVRCPSRSWVNCIAKDSGDWFWAGTEGDGLWHVNVSSGERARVDGTSSNYIRSLAKDLNGRLWIGTISGLNILDTDSGKMETMLNDPFDNGSFPDNSVRSLYYDSSGGMWLGTWYAGAAYWHPERARFKTIRQSPDGNSPNDNVISRIIEGPDGSVWVGTNKGGLNHYDPATGKWEHMRFSADKGGGMPESDNIKAIWCGRDDASVYVGAHAAPLRILDRRSGIVRSEVRIRNVYSIVQADENHLWIGTLGGLYLYSVRNGAIREYGELHGARILAIHVDGGGNLWVGTQDGVKVFSVDGNHGLSPILQGTTPEISYAQCFHERSDMSVWIGTREGLWVVCRRDWTMSRYDVHDGMPGNWVFGIEEDDAGQLWVSTGRGLWCMDPATDACKTYTARDGLPSDQFTEYASCRMRDGEMWFGGIGGIVTFRPEQFKTGTSTPAPIITGLYVDGEKIRPKSPDGTIALNYRQNSFTVKFSVPDYVSAGQDSFLYTMSGLEKSWHATSSHEVVYTHLGKGHYSFKLKAANRDGYWSPVMKTLRVRIVPPWYGTTFVRVMALLLAIAAIASVITMQIRQKELKGKLEMEQQKRSHREEISKFKALAFINSDVRGENAAIRKASISKADESLISRAMDIVEQNIDNESFGVEDFAAALGMSRSNLHLRIKEITGESALDMIHKIRFSKACALLSEGNLNIAEISGKCGFRSPSYFTVSFRKYMGCSPSEYASRES